MSKLTHETKLLINKEIKTLKVLVNLLETSDSAEKVLKELRDIKLSILEEQK